MPSNCSPEIKRTLIKNGATLFFSSAIPVGVHLAIDRDFDPEKDKFYTTLPLWAITLFIAILTLVIRVGTEQLIERGGRLRTRMFSTCHTNKDKDLEKPLVAATEDTNPGPRNIPRDMVIVLIPLAVALLSSLVVSEITSRTPGGKYRFYNDVPPVATTLTIALMTLVMHSATRWSMNKCFPDHVSAPPVDPREAPKLQ